MSGRLLLPVMTLVCLVWLGAASTEARSASAITAITSLNTLRELNGIPGSLEEDVRLSEGCRLHSRYMSTANHYRQGRGFVPHVERPDQPNHTALGAEAAGRSNLLESNRSVLGFEFRRPDRHPWDGAPLHFRGLLDPRATTAWYGDFRSRFACMGTDWPLIEPAGELEPFYSFPGNGRTGVPTGATITPEWPYNPATRAGLRIGQLAGPIIYLFSTRSAGIVAHRVSDARGRRVPTSVASRHNFIFVKKPLTPNTSYRVSVTWAMHAPDGSRPTELQQFSFKTGSAPRLQAGQRVQTRIRLRSKRRVGRLLRFKVSVGAAAGRMATLSTRLYDCREFPLCKPAGPLRKKRFRLSKQTPHRVRVPRAPARGRFEFNVEVFVPKFTKDGVPHSGAGASWRVRP